jgi:hypothetical protein
MAIVRLMKRSSGGKMSGVKIGSFDGSTGTKGGTGEVGVVGVSVCGGTLLVLGVVGVVMLLFIGTLVRVRDDRQRNKVDRNHRTQLLLLSVLMMRLMMA